MDYRYVHYVIRFCPLFRAFLRTSWVLIGIRGVMETLNICCLRTAEQIIYIFIDNLHSHSFCLELRDKQALSHLYPHISLHSIKHHGLTWPRACHKWQCTCQWCQWSAIRAYRRGGHEHPALRRGIRHAKAVGTALQGWFGVVKDAQGSIQPRGFP